MNAPTNQKPLADMPTRKSLTKRELNEVARRFAAALLACTEPSQAFNGDLDYDEVREVEKLLTGYAIRLWKGPIDGDTTSIVDDILNKRS